MSIENKNVSPDKEREMLEWQADVARNRLVRTLTMLDQKRHKLMDVRGQVASYKRPLIMIGSGLLLLVAGGVASAIASARYRKHHMNHARWEAAKRVWQHPDHVAVRAKDRPWYHKVLARAGVALVGLAIRQLTKSVDRHAITHGTSSRGALPAHT